MKTKFLKIEEIAELLRVSRTTIFKLLWTKRLNGYQVGKQWRITEQDVKDYLDKNSNQEPIYEN